MPDTRIMSRAPGCVWRRWRGSVLVMGPDREPVQLDGAAAVLWLHLDDAAALDDVRGASESAWASAPADAGDPAVLLDEARATLVARGLVVEVVR